MPAHPATWRGAPVTVRGGPFLDGEFLADLGATLSAEVGLRDEVRHRWLAPAGSPLLSWGRRTGARPRAARSPWTARPTTGRRRLWDRACPSWWRCRAATSTLARHVRGSRWRSPGRRWWPRWPPPCGYRAGSPGPWAGWPTPRGAWRAAISTARCPSPPATRSGTWRGAFNTMTAELRASRERAVQAERVAAWREMARRLAHELKNPALPHPALDRDPASEPRPGRGAGAARVRVPLPRVQRHHPGRAALAAAHRRRVRRVRAHAAPEPRPTDVNAVVEKVLALHRARRGRGPHGDGASPRAADRSPRTRPAGARAGQPGAQRPRGHARRRHAARPHAARDGTVSIEVAGRRPGHHGGAAHAPLRPLLHDQEGRAPASAWPSSRASSPTTAARVEVKSAPGAGTTVTLVLPARRADV
jgi:hypothetical protein